MTLLAILLVFVLLQYWGSGGPIQRDGWYFDWQTQLETWLAHGRDKPLHFALSVLGPVIAILFVDVAIEGVWWGGLELVLSVLVLLYSLGRGDLSRDIADYLERWERGDLQAILEALRENNEELPAVDSDEDIHREARRRLYTRGFERLFAVLFWFALAGPAGALAYRLVRLYRDSGPEGIRDTTLHVMEWVPVRLMVAGFAIIGDYVRTSDEIGKKIWESGLSSAEILVAGGNAALGIPTQSMDELAASMSSRDEARHQLEAIELLFRRSLLLWLAVIAVLEILF